MLIYDKNHYIKIKNAMNKKCDKAMKLLYSNLKQMKKPFFKNGEQEGKIVPVWGLVPVGEEKI
jgi:hypothetical protein